MKIRFSQIGGWSGGSWQFDGMSLSKFKAEHQIDPFPRKGVMAILTGPAGTHYAITSEVTHTIRGIDHDHGHQYPWKYEEPTFIIGNCPIPVPAGLIWDSGYSIILEVS